MQSHFLEQKFSYDGSQLRSLYGYLDHGVLGPSTISWIGKCDIPFSHMVDGEDLLAKAVIQGDEMLHFIIEFFDRDLFSGVAIQRLFASIMRDYLAAKAKSVLNGKELLRHGDDIYLEERKLSISIATKSPVSTMIHFAVNVTNEGTPVQTLSLNDLKLDPKKVAEDVMHIFRNEYISIVTATQKVRPVP